MTTLDRTTDMLAKLVSFDTTSRRTNLELIDWVEAQLAPIAGHIQRLPNADGDKANLWVRIGPDAPDGIILSGHTDVVPVDGQPWTTDPWELVKNTDKLFARGTCDMKGFIALCMAFADEFAKGELTRPVHFAFSYDEEVGCAGAHDMIQAIAAHAQRPSLCWVGEPTLWSVVSGHKGIQTYEVRVTGLEAHSSLPHLGASAIHEAVALMAALRGVAMKAEASPPPDSPFDPPHATLTIGTVNGGTAGNILARECSFVFDLRRPAGVDANEMLAPFFAQVDEINQRLKQVSPDCGVAVEKHADAPPLRPDPDSSAEQFVRSLTGDNATHFAAYAAEAGQFQEAGIPTVICGPGSIEQAHQPNEWVAVSELARGVDLFHALNKRLRA